MQFEYFFHGISLLHIPGQMSSK